MRFKMLSVCFFTYKSLSKPIVFIFCLRKIHEYSNPESRKKSNASAHSRMLLLFFYDFPLSSFVGAAELP